MDICTAHCWWKFRRTHLLIYILNSPQCAIKVVRMLKKAAGDVILRNVFWYFELEVFVHSCHVFHHIWWMHFCVTISGFRQSWTSPLWPIAVDEPNTSGWSFVCAWVLPPAILANQLWTLDFFPLTKSGEGYTGFGTLVSWKEASRRAHCSAHCLRALLDIRGHDFVLVYL